MGGSTNAQGPQRPRIVSVELAKAERKPVPVDVDAIGMVTPISSVALKSRLETTIVAVHFEDGAKVNEGDLLFTLDSAPDRRPDRAGRGRAGQGSGAARRRAARSAALHRSDRRRARPPQVNVDNAQTSPTS